jgi:transaldolase
MTSIDSLSIEIFADGADKATMLEMASKPFIKGLTTNPTLMKKAGITDYKEFASSVLQDVTKKPISFEVFSDDFLEMERQALEISGWGNNVYVKIPVTNTHKEPCYGLINRLSHSGVKLNVTALTTLRQVEQVADNLSKNVPSYISVFAGRIADTGIDPVPIIRDAVKYIKDSKNIKLIWASPRELLNIFQAESVGCHIITATNEILNKLELIGKDLEEYSLDTVKMFYKDAVSAGYSI